MALPGIQINFTNGNIGTITPNADGVLGVVANNPTLGNLGFGEAVLLTSLASAEEGYGITDSSSPDLWAFLASVYSKTPAAEVWLMIETQATAYSSLVESAQTLAIAAEGRIRAMFLLMSPASGYTPSIQDGLDEEVYIAMEAAELLGVDLTTQYYAPLVTFVGAYGFDSTETHLDMLDLTELNYTRVGLIAADNPETIGMVAGRIAGTPVQRHIGRKKDGAIANKWQYGVEDATTYNYIETLMNKGAIVGRTYVGSAGVFIADDPLCASPISDYGQLSRRRSIDKAYRICYATLIEEMLDEIPIDGNGRIAATLIKSWQQKVANALENQMTANGEVSTDATNPNDTGVRVFIDPDQNVLGSGNIVVNVGIRPFGYAKYITINLGFQV